MIKKLLLLLVFLLLVVTVSAHHPDHEEVELEPAQILKDQALQIIIVAAVITTIAVIVSVIHEKNLTHNLKVLFFLMIALPVIVATIYSAGTTIYLNVESETGGPVHWHADFEIWDCGTSIDLVDPEGLLNRIGTPILHEHNDFRIHVEGTLIEKKESSLGRFFQVIGGALTDNSIVIPTNEGELVRENGDLCNGQPAELQVFRYYVTNPDARPWIYEQEKLDNYVDYILSPHTNVPPGDCVIFEYGPSKESTDNICESYNVGMRRGDLRGS